MMFEEIFSVQEDARLNGLRTLYHESPMGRSEKRPFYYSGDRWITLSFLEGWRQFEKEPTTVLRRAKTEAYALDQSKPLIHPDEELVGRPDFEPYTRDEQARFDELLKTMPMMPHIHKRGRTDHVGLDYGKLLRLGVDGLLAEIKTHQDALTLDGGPAFRENLRKWEFYEGSRIELEALINLAKRYADHARAMGETSPRRAEALLQVAQTLDRVPRYPARTFREAIQSVHFYTFCLFGLYALGRPDRYLLPFYEADRAAGRLTLAEAQFMIDQFCMLTNTWAFSSAAVGLMVGGSDARGPVENELTAMFVHSISHTRMAMPGISLCVADVQNSAVLKQAIITLSQGYSHPALYNDRAVTQSLIRYGVRPQDAYEYVNTTCVEISVSGKTDAWTTCPWVNLAQLLLDTMAQREFESADELFDSFRARVAEHMIKENRLMALLQMERERNGAMPLRTSCLIDDCIASGSSLAQGGARYNPVFPAYVGLANVVDSLAAIQRLVYDEKRLSYAQLMAVLNRNYEGDEPLRQMLIRRMPHYGNDLPQTDEWVKRVTDVLKESCSSLPTWRGSQVIPGIFSFSQHAVMGSRTAATPDGRKAGTPLANSCGAYQGRDVSGPTASILSASCWDEGYFIGGVALNMRFSRDIMLSRGGDNIRALLQTFFDRGGVQMQINVVNPDQLKQAKQHPEAYGDLIVRVGGYSDYFVRLPESLQDEVMARTEHAV